ncbi:prolyl 4-hydroxylase 5-like [Raphanus sativus]|uniref:Prolyl 4-hydroxylase 5-like n=1 Tax=Raphanus sativus TaxID=3726 RepID=A0A9W3CS56_RAPSA|nr:prolyl 4-hydroxylase 5-like [Raphanus sativus]XP_056860024.1 prolyl 4-hydroxylase 5-like [Raphanus sativus]
MTSLHYAASIPSLHLLSKCKSIDSLRKAHTILTRNGLMSDISRATKLLLSPEQNRESFEVVKFQVLHYQVGQKYEPHYDYFLDEFNTKNGGQRIATVLMYLSDVDDGGETVFPAAKGNISAVQWWNELSKCGKEGLHVLPKKRDALLFWNMRHDASLDPSNGCPVVKGNNWSSTKWFHVHEFKV